MTPPISNSQSAKVSRSRRSIMNFVNRGAHRRRAACSCLAMIRRRSPACPFSRRRDVCRTDRFHRGGRGPVRHPLRHRALLRRPGVRTISTAALLRSERLAAEEPSPTCCAGTRTAASAPAGPTGRRARFATSRPRASTGARLAHRLRRPREPADPDRRAQHPDRSGLVGARLAGELRRAEARQRARASPSTTLPPIDVVLVSHCHYDHLDVETLSRLAQAHPAARHHAARQRHDHARRTTRRSAPRRYDWHERVDLGHGVAVTLVPTRHWSARGLSDRNKALWAAFVIETPAGRIYHVGDTGYGDGHHFRDARDRTGRSGSRSCRSAPTSRAGSCATST